MTKQYYIDLSRNELAMVSYFPALELKNKPEVEWIGDVLIPMLLPLVKRKNQKISQIPITLWLATRQTARRFRQELFLFQQPANPSAIIKQAMRSVLQKIGSGMIFAGQELIPDYTVPVCQIFRGKLIRFYYGSEDVEDRYLPAFNWIGGAPESPIDKSTTILENLESEILFMRANINTVMNGEYYRKFQQALNHIGIEE
jgi:hypothetical protein